MPVEYLPDRIDPEIYSLLSFRVHPAKHARSLLFDYLQQ